VRPQGRVGDIRGVKERLRERLTLALDYVHLMKRDTRSWF
jgi:hypothetical protein